MSIKELLDPILDQGIRHTNYFEGRLLTGEDLRNQQQANRDHDRRLGRSIGPGIIEGLEVELLHDGLDGSAPTVRVTKGLAINRKGDIFGLPGNDITLALTDSRKPPKWQPAEFYTCVGPAGVQHLPSGVGIYILVMSPAAAYKQRAPKSGLGDEGVVRGCGSRYIQEGVQFRLVELTASMLSTLEGLSKSTGRLLEDNLLNEHEPVLKADLPRLSKLRNVLAHLCLGTDQLAQFAIDPFTASDMQSTLMNYGIVDELHGLGELTDCDVPLALLYWTLDGVAFCDLWSVRRRAYELTVSTSWPNLVGQRKLVEAEAALLQFQAHIHDIAKTHPSPTSIQADAYFKYLPPVGIIPVASLKYKEGLDYFGFFSTAPRLDPVYLEGIRLKALIQESLQYHPINYDDKELIWFYLVRENVESIRAADLNQPRLYMVYSSGYIPYAAHARYNLSRWDYSNYM